MRLELHCCMIVCAAFSNSSAVSGWACILYCAIWHQIFIAHRESISIIKQSFYPTLSLVLCWSSDLEQCRWCSNWHVIKDYQQATAQMTIYFHSSIHSWNSSLLVFVSVILSVSVWVRGRLYSKNSTIMVDMNYINVT